MEPIQELVILAWVFRIVGTLVGLLVLYMGYRLFQRPQGGAGSAGNVGVVHGAYGAGKLTLKGQAGTFLVILGTIVIGISLLRPMEFSRTVRREGTNGAESYKPVVKGTTPLQEAIDRLGKAESTAAASRRDAQVAQEELSEKYKMSRRSTTPAEDSARDRRLAQAYTRDSALVAKVVRRARVDSLAAAALRDSLRAQ